MKWNRGLAGLAILTLGIGMAWSSGVFTAASHVIGLVALAILAPAAAALGSGRLGVNQVALIISAALLVVARLSSDVEVRWYAMPLIFFVPFFASRTYERRLSEGTSEKM